MTEDNNIPDGLGDKDAKRFIREADDRIFKRVEKSGRRVRPASVKFPIYWECPKCHTCTNENECPVCHKSKKPSKDYLSDWEQFKVDAIQVVVGLLLLGAVAFFMILLYMSFLFVLHGFHF